MNGKGVGPNPEGDSGVSNTEEVERYLRQMKQSWDNRNTRDKSASPSSTWIASVVFCLALLGQVTVQGLLGKGFFTQAATV